MDFFTVQMIVSIYTTYFNVKTFYSLPTQRVDVFCMILKQRLLS